MRHTGWIVVIAMSIALIGCASTQQAISDYTKGATTPLEENEISPSDSVQPIVSTVSMIPVVGGFAPIIGTALAGLATWQRGRRIRKGKPSSQNPITGWMGNATGAETIVQSLANVVTGLFEVGKDGSAMKRAWKMGLTTALSIGAGALTIPAVRDFVVQHPVIVAGITGLSALFGGLEKAVSTVLPVAPDAHPTQPVATGSPA